MLPHNIASKGIFETVSIATNKGHQYFAVKILNIEDDCDAHEHIYEITLQKRNVH